MVTKTNEEMSFGRESSENQQQETHVNRFKGETRKKKFRKNVSLFYRLPQM